MPKKSSGSKKASTAPPTSEVPDKKEDKDNTDPQPTPDDDADEPAEPVEKGIRGEASKAMQNVTSYVQESEKEVDQTKLNQAMESLKDASMKKKAEKDQSTRPPEQEKAILPKEDIELIMTEMQVTKPFAERHLREHKGDVVAALREILVSEKPLR